MIKSKNLFFLLLLLFPLNLLYLLFSSPFQSPNPFLIYLLLFTSGVGLLSLLAAPHLPAFFLKIKPTWLKFLLPALLLSFLEETTAFFTKIGLFEENQLSFLTGMILGVPPLFLWALGAYLVVLKYQYQKRELYLLLGLSGWINEMLIVGRVFQVPKLAFFLFPAVALSYLVLIYLPLQLVPTEIEKGRKSKARILAASLLPSFFFVLGGIVGTKILLLINLQH